MGNCKNISCILCKFSAYIPMSTIPGFTSVLQSSWHKNLQPITGRIQYTGENIMICEMSPICEQSYLVLAYCKCVSCIVQKFSGQILMFRTLHPVDTQTYNILQNYNTPTGFKEYINCYSCKIHQKYIKNHLYIFSKVLYIPLFSKQYIRGSNKNISNICFYWTYICSTTQALLNL